MIFSLRRITFFLFFYCSGTLLVWRIAGWPSKFEDYELWNADVVTKLRDLYDNQGYQLVIFSNQGGIRKVRT